MKRLSSLRLPIILALCSLFIVSGNTFADKMPPKAKAKHVHKKAKAIKRPAKKKTAKVIRQDRTPVPGMTGEELSKDWYRVRAWPNETIDPNAYPSALEQARRIPVLGAHKSKNGTLASPITWKLTGPFNIGGRVTSVAAHPTNKNLFYAAAANGGVWETVDHGASWVSVTDTFATLSMGAVVLDPQHPDTIYLGQGEPNGSDAYPGHGVWRSLDGGKSWSFLGLEKTQYISKIIVDPTNSNVIYVASPGPSKGNANCGVFKSTDFGATWAKVTKTTLPVYDLAMNPRNNNELVAAIWDGDHSSLTPFGSNSGLWYSSDAGGVWNRIDTVSGIGLPNGKTYRRLMRSALYWGDTKPDPTLYAIFTKADTNRITKYLIDADMYGLYSSTSPSTSWTHLQDSTMRIGYKFGGYDSVDIFNHQGTYDIQLAGNPLKPDELYISCIDVLRSTDRGVSFKDITNNYSEHYITGDRTTHSDQHGLTFTADESGNDLLAYSDGGVFSTIDFGAKWTQIGNMPITQFWAIRTWDAQMAKFGATVPIDSIKAIGGTQDNGSLALGLIPNDWKWINSGDGGTPVPHPTDPNILMTTIQQGGAYLRTSLDSIKPNRMPDWEGKDTTDYNTKWHSFRAAALRGLIDTTEPVTFIPPWVIDERKPEDVYTSRLRVYKATLNYEHPSPDSAKIRVMSPYLAGNFTNPKAWYYGTIESMALGVRDAVGRPMMWVGASSIPVLWRSLSQPELPIDSMPRWKPDTLGLPRRTVTSIVPDRSDSLLAFVSLSGFEGSTAATKGHVFRRDPATGRWQNISGNLPNVPVTAILIDTLPEQGRPEYKNRTIIASTDVGMFVTEDGGANWYTLGTGMPNIAVSDISMYKNLLIAGTHGRSAWVADISNLQGSPKSVESPKAAAHEAFVTISPNPISLTSQERVLSIRMNGIESHDELKIELVNLESGVIMHSDNFNARNGAVRFEIPSTLSAGAYAIRVYSEAKIVATGRVSVIK